MQSDIEDAILISTDHEMLSYQVHAYAEKAQFSQYLRERNSSLIKPEEEKKALAAAENCFRDISSLADDFKSQRTLGKRLRSLKDKEREFD